MKNKILAVLLIGISLLTAQCKKEGPAGPEGVPGPQGEAGPQGPQGPGGAPGSSSVRSKTVTYTNAQWGNNMITHWFSTSAGSAVGHFARYVDISVPLITQAIVDNGVVLVYFTPDESTAPYASLPYSRSNLSSQYTINLDYLHSIGKIRLLFFFSKNATAEPNPPSVTTWTIPTYKFKYVLIPGTAIAGRSTTGGTEQTVILKGNSYTMTELKNMPYSSICRLLDIAE